MVDFGVVRRGGRVVSSSSFFFVCGLVVVGLSLSLCSVELVQLVQLVV